MFGGLFRDKVKLILYEQIVQKLEHNLNSLTYEKKLILHQTTLLSVCIIVLDYQFTI